jgi:hypothetical protein
MASRSRLYTRFRPPRTQQSEDTIRKSNLIIFDINFNHHLITDPLFQMKIFTEEEIDACLDYMTSEIDDIHLFVSNVIIDVFIQLISEHPQIKSVYVFCKDQQYQNHSYDGPKLRGIFRDFNTMFKQFQDDITELKNQYYFEQSTFQNINPESGEVLWWKFFDKILEHIQHTNIAKEEFIDFSKDTFRDNERELRRIEEFESNYTSDKAIYWYTRESFFYRFLNQTLRTRNNFNNIFKLRMILTDLVSGLKTAQLDFDNTTQDPLIVYRGQMVRTEDILMFKSAIRNTVFFNNFLSTSTDQEVARAFAVSSHDNSAGYGSLLFTLEVDPTSTDTGRTPFANISRYSVYQNEEEVLFSMHSTFEVQSVELDEENLWNIRLKFKENLWDTDFDERSIFSPHADQIFIRNLSKENKQFIAFQLLLDIILRLDQTKYAKQELLQFFTSKYQHDPAELRNIEKFANEYQSKDAARWYSKGCFLYRLLNESLRIETIDSIVKMRYYIHDLHNQLAELQDNFIKSLNREKDLTLYRGQTMKINQLNEIKENYDGFISMNSFLSATQDEDVAILFSGDGVTTAADEVSVIYQMLIDTNIRSTPYAKIKSVMKDEQEILFSMGAVFRIGEVSKVPDHNAVSCVKLTMVHIEDELWNKLTAHLD